MQGILDTKKIRSTWNGPLVFGGSDRARTDDPLRVRQVLSQLSYAPMFAYTREKISIWQVHLSKESS